MKSFFQALMTARGTVQQLAWKQHPCDYSSGSFFPPFKMMNHYLSSITAVLLCTLTTGFYLPGVAPREFKEGDNVPLKVDKISSVRSQLPYR
jgi:hypothetical protein